MQHGDGAREVSTLGPTAADVNVLLDAQVQAGQQRNGGAPHRHVLDELGDESDLPFPGLAGRRPERTTGGGPGPSPASGEAFGSALGEAPGSALGEVPGSALGDAGSAGSFAGPLANLDSFWKAAVQAEAGLITGGPLDMAPTALADGIIVVGQAGEPSGPDSVPDATAPTRGTGDLETGAAGSGASMTDGMTGRAVDAGDLAASMAGTEVSDAAEVQAASSPAAGLVAGILPMSREPAGGADAEPADQPAQQLPSTLGGATASALTPMDVADLDLVVAAASRRKGWARRPLALARSHRRPPATAGEPEAEAADIPVVAPAGRSLAASGSGLRSLALRRPPVPLLVAAVALLVAALVAVAVLRTGGTVAPSAPAAALVHHPTSSSRSSSAKASASTVPKSSLPKSALLPPPPSGSSAASVPAGSATVPAGSSGTTAGSNPSPALSQGAAKLALARVWQTRQAALQQHAAGALAAVDSGAALQGDTAAVEAQAAPATVDLSKASVVLLSAQSWPLDFAAVVPGTTAGGQAVDELANLVQPAQGAPWTFTLVVEIPLAELAAVPRSAGPLSATTLDTLAADWQQWAATGSAPNGAPFAAGDAYGAVGQAVADQESMSQLQGLREQVTFQPETPSIVQPSASGPSGPSGPSAVCAAIQQTAVFTSTSAKPVTQPADRSTFGPGLVPGQYRSVTEESVVQVCLAQTSGGTAVLGGNGGRYATAGVAA